MRRLRRRRFACVVASRRTQASLPHAHGWICYWRARLLSNATRGEHAQHSRVQRAVWNSPPVAQLHREQRERGARENRFGPLAPGVPPRPGQPVFRLSLLFAISLSLVRAWSPVCDTSSHRPRRSPRRLHRLPRRHRNRRTRRPLPREARLLQSPPRLPHGRLPAPQRHGQNSKTPAAQNASPVKVAAPKGITTLPVDLLPPSSSAVERSSQHV